MIRAAQHFEITASQDFRFPAAAVLLASLAACAAPGDEVRDASNNTGIIQDNIQDSGMNIQDLVNGYALFRLEADLSHLSENDREVVRLLIEASRPMDDVFWMQAYGDKEEALALAQGDEAARAATSRSTMGPGTGCVPTLPSSPGLAPSRRARTSIPPT